MWERFCYRMRGNGAKSFLLTNSEYEYTDVSKIPVILAHSVE